MLHQKIKKQKRSGKKPIEGVSIPGERTQFYLRNSLEHFPCATGPISSIVGEVGLSLKQAGQVNRQ